MDLTSCFTIHLLHQLHTLTTQRRTHFLLSFPNSHLASSSSLLSRCSGDWAGGWGYWWGWSPSPGGARAGTPTPAPAAPPPPATSSRCEWLEGVDTGSVTLDVDLGTLDVDRAFICTGSNSHYHIAHSQPMQSLR